MKANVFFFVSTIGFALLAVLGAVALIYSVWLLRKMNHIATRVEENIDSVGDEVKALIADLRESTLFRFLFGRRRSVRSDKT